MSEDTFATLIFILGLILVFISGLGLARLLTATVALVV